MLSLTTYGHLWVDDIREEQSTEHPRFTWRTTASLKTSHLAGDRFRDRMIGNISEGEVQLESSIGGSENSG